MPGWRRIRRVSMNGFPQGNPFFKDPFHFVPESFRGTKLSASHDPDDIS
jgi:hypothetical protein